MGQDGGKEEGLTRFAIPLTACAIITAQLIMAVVTRVAGQYTQRGWGRKPLFLIGISSLPIRCALIILLKDVGHNYLLLTQIFDGISGGLFGLIHPYIVADITFGTGRFNAVSKCFRLYVRMYAKVFRNILTMNFVHSGLDGVCVRFRCHSVKLFGTKGRRTLWLRD